MVSMPLTHTIEKVKEFNFYLSLFHRKSKFIHVLKKPKHRLREGIIGVKRQAPGLVQALGQHTICLSQARLADDLGAAPGILGEELAPAPQLLEELGLLGSLEPQVDNTGATADCKARRSSRAKAVPWPTMA